MTVAAWPSDFMKDWPAQAYGLFNKHDYKEFQAT